MFENFDFGSDVVNKLIDFEINADMPFGQQIYSLKEDMLQVVYKNNYLIDVGWRPEFELEGNFIAVLIKDFDWDNPVLCEECKDLTTLEKCLNNFVQFINEISPMSRKSK